MNFNESIVEEMSQIVEQPRRAIPSSTPITELMDVEPSPSLSVISGISRGSSSSNASRLSQLNTNEPEYTFEENQEDNIPLVLDPHKARDNLQYPHETYGLFRVLYQCKDVMQVVFQWIKTFKSNKQDALIHLLQLLVDTCGYTKFKLVDYIDLGKPQSDGIFTYLENHPTKELEILGDYVFKTKKEKMRCVQENIFKFIQGIIIVSFEKHVMRDYSLTFALVPFLNRMASSKSRSIRHTGIVMMVKLMSVFTRVWIELHRESVSNTLTNDSESTSERGNEIQVQEVITLFESSILRNCCLQDDAMKFMRVDYVNEIPIWCCIRPDYFIQENYLKTILKLIVDAAHEVREAAIKTSTCLFVEPTYQEMFAPFSKRFMCMIGERLVDTNYDVSIAAVSAFTKIIPTHVRKIPSKYRNKIYSFIYHKNYPLGASAGEFFINSLQYSREISTEDLLKLIVDDHRNMSTRDHIPVFVESLLPHCPELTDWDAIIDLLLVDELESEEKEDLLDIMCHAMMQSLTGQSQIVRDKCKKNKVKENIKSKLEVELVRKLPRAVKQFKNNVKCIESFSNLLNHFDFPKLSHNLAASAALITIFKYLSEIYTECDNEVLLEKVTSLFAKINQQPFGDIEDIILQIQKTTMDLFLQNIDDPENTNFEMATLTLSIIFDKFDLTNCMEWDLLKLTFNVTSVKTLTYIIKICKSFISWEMRNVTPDQDLTSLKNEFEEYVDFCFNILHTSKFQLVRNVAFTCVCELHVTCATEARTNNLLRSCINKFNDERSQCLLKFNEKILLSQQNSTPEYREKYFKNFIALIYEGIIPFPYLSHITQHYYTLMDDYKETFESIFQSVKQLGIHPFSLVIVDTVRVPFENLLQLFESPIDLKSAECKSLRKLAKYLQNSLKAEIHPLKIALQLGIRYALKHQQYIFLTFIKFFADDLTKTDKLEIKTFLLDRLANEHLNNCHVLKFLGHLGKK